MFGTIATNPMTRVNDILSSDTKDKLRAELEPYSDNSSLPLRDLIVNVRNKNANPGGNNGTAPFKGLGGGYYHTLLRAAQGKIKQSDGTYDENSEASVELSGLITDYGFTPSNNDQTTGSGNLAVDTYQTVKHGNAVVEVHNYLWDITIKPNGYVIHKIADLAGYPSPDDPDSPDLVYPPDSVLDNWDPFTGTLFFDRDMKKRIWRLGFNVKLHARGNDAIKIEDVWKDGFRIRNSDKDLKHLKKADANSCIDIFLKVSDKNDPATIPTNTLGEHSYCLGRCADPAIINSR